jgi:hypothetical protein
VQTRRVDFRRGSSFAFERSTRGAFAAQSDREVIMFLALFIVLFICWVFGFVVFHVAGGLIHLLLIVAVISLVWHLVGGRAAV